MPAQIIVYESFDSLPDATRTALSYPAQPDFFLSLQWFELLYDSCLVNVLTPRIYVRLGADGEIEAALFTGVADRAGRRELRSLCNFYSIKFDVSVLRGGDSPTLARSEFVAHIAAEKPRWDSVQLTTLQRHDNAADDLAAALSESGFTIHTYPQYENWIHQVQGQSFAEYYENRPSQVRNTIQRRQRKLERAHEYSIDVVRDEGELLEAAVAAFNAVYQSSWKQAEPFPNFIPSLARAAARCGTLRLGILQVDGKPAAAQLWITSGGCAVIYKLAYAEAYADFGVGSILSRELFRIALDQDHVQLIDYGVGSEPYKKDWMSTVRRIEGIEAYNRATPLGWSLGAAEFAKQRLRCWRDAWRQRGA